MYALLEISSRIQILLDLKIIKYYVIHVVRKHQLSEGILAAWHGNQLPNLLNVIFIFVLSQHDRNKSDSSHDLSHQTNCTSY